MTVIPICQILPICQMLPICQVTLPTPLTGGGTALMCRESITVTKVAVGEKKSFEFSEWIILGQGSRKIRIVIVYRLQYSPNHPVTTGLFFDEFSDYLESSHLSPF